jgi:hypothetical protein
MSKQILFLMTGLSLAISSAGCCCLGHMGCNRNPCGCPPAGGGGVLYPPATSMYQSADPSQLSYTSSTTQTAYAGGITTTAAAPPPIMGAPIYNAAPGTYTAAPTQSLPTYR